MCVPRRAGDVFLASMKLDEVASSMSVVGQTKL